MASFGSIAANSDFSQMTGTSAADNASAGNIGEYISSNVVIGSAVSMSNGVSTTITGIALTIGDWDVQGQASLSYTSATQSGDSKAFIGTGTTLTIDGTEGYDNTRLTTTTTAKTITLARKRISIGAGATYNLNALANFSAGTCGGFGFISARRVR